MSLDLCGTNQSRPFQTTCKTICSTSFFNCGAKPLAHRLIRVVVAVVVVVVVAGVVIGKGDHVMTCPFFVKQYLLYFQRLILHLRSQHEPESPNLVSAGAPALSGVTRCQLQKFAKQSSIHISLSNYAAAH